MWGPLWRLFRRCGRFRRAGRHHGRAAGGASVLIRFHAAGLCLIVNTAPVAFGAMGIPIIVAGQVTGLDSFAIGQMAGRQLPLLTIVVLFWIMAIMDGWRGVKETWPAVIVAGDRSRLPSSSAQLSGARAASILSPRSPHSFLLTLFLRIWQPVRIFRFSETESPHAGQPVKRQKYTTGQVVRAWMPFLFLTATVTVWSIPPFKALFGKGGALAESVLSLLCPALMAG
ncbi:L-lactate permease [Pantoea ananatis]